jgi:thiol-disulfide isomerase/thioredoxin
MKRGLCFLVIVLLGFNNLHAQIIWQTNFEEAKRAAFKSGKNIVIECFHPECSHCIALNENLKNETLAKYLNENYTNMKLDLTNLDQVKLLESKNIRLINYPIFLFFDNAGNLQYFIEPKESPQEIIRQFEEERGSTCVDCEKATNPTTIEKVRCAIYYRLTKNYEKSNAICSKFFKELPEDEKIKVGPWTIFKKVVYSTNNEFFNYYINKPALTGTLEGTSGKEKDVFISIIQQQIKYLENKADFPKWELDSLDSYLTKMGGNEKQKLTWMWSLKLGYYLTAKDFKSAKSLCYKMSEFYPDVNTYSFLSEKINTKVEGVEMYDYFLEIKDKWLAGLKDPKHKSTYYVQAAQYYSKSGQKTACVNSLSQAVQFGLPISEKNAFIQKYCR